MVDRQRDALRWVLDDLAAQDRRHDHLLIKDPYQLGWRCDVRGCRFFKPAHEFDVMRVAA